MRGRAKNTAYHAGDVMTHMLAENICLCNPFFDERCRNELREINKHEIVMKICDMLGSCPSNIGKAEEIFDVMMYDIANFVVHHEYISSTGVNAELLLWLDGKTNPLKAKKLANFMKKFLK